MKVSKNKTQLKSIKNQKKSPKSPISKWPVKTCKHAYKIIPVCFIQNDTNQNRGPKFEASQGPISVKFVKRSITGTLNFTKGEISEVVLNTMMIWDRLHQIRRLLDPFSAVFRLRLLFFGKFEDF